MSTETIITKKPTPLSQLLDEYYAMSHFIVARALEMGRTVSASEQKQLQAIARTIKTLSSTFEPEEAKDTLYVIRPKRRDKSE